MTLIWASVLLGVGFGVAARLGSFCLLRGLVQAMERPPAGKRAVAPALQACALALAVALLATQGLALSGQLDLTRTLPMRAQFSPLGMLAGGLLSAAAWRWRGPVPRGRWCWWPGATCGRCGYCCGWG